MSANEKTPLAREQGGAEPYYSGPLYSDKTPTVTVAPQYSTVNGPPPDDYLTMSILTIVFCFWPLGVVALFKSLEVRNANARGDFNAAQIASRSALKFNKLSIFIGVALLVVTIVFIALFQLFWIIPAVTFPHPHFNITMPEH